MPFLWLALRKGVYFLAALEFFGGKKLLFPEVSHEHLFHLGNTEQRRLPR